ncbi:glycosyltransferase family 2 protein, partial [Patescibacteria group bacterium]|nr:glycosyltransferase family 2 protein [Patescibacteria group bacterium]
MTLSIIIPVYNEKETILKLLKQVEAVDFGVEYEIIIVDDCSTDGTRKLLHSLKGWTFKSNIKVIFKDKNQGKGAALRRGFTEASGEIIIVQDADLEYQPQDLPQLIKPILQGQTSIVYGSRFLPPHDKNYFRLHYVGNYFMAWLFRFLYSTKITDPATCYKIFKREILNKIPPLRLNGFEMESEFTAKILRAGYQILELPIQYQARSLTEGKKLNWRHSF